MRLLKSDVEYRFVIWQAPSSRESSWKSSWVWYDHETNQDTAKIDLISIDDKSGSVRLHLVVEGNWNNNDNKIEGIVNRLNSYIYFVKSGQLAIRHNYSDRPVKFLVHCEHVPSKLAKLTFAKMRTHLLYEAIAFGVTIGSDLISEIELPDEPTRIG